MIKAEPLKWTLEEVIQMLRLKTATEIFDFIKEKEKEKSAVEWLKEEILKSYNRSRDKDTFHSRTPCNIQEAFEDVTKKQEAEK